MRAIMGERRFQREYMNNPINEGTIFEEKHIRFGKMLRMREYRGIICYTDPSFQILGDGRLQGNDAGRHHAAGEIPRTESVC